MGLDRRLVAILFFNGINDVTKVEKYIGRKDDYLEVIIDGQLEKLKIPGVIYPENVPSDIETKIKEVDKNVEIIEKMEIFTNNLEEVVESVKKSLNDSFTTTIITEIKETLSFEELEKTEIENKKVLKSIKKEKVENKKSKVKPKQLDNDIDNFIDSI